MPTPIVHRLEPRLCFAAGPTVTGELFVGGDDVTALVIGFSGPLDPATARNPDNYLFGGTRGRGRDVHKTPFGTPAYDDDAHAVTLTFDKPLTLTRFKRLKVIVRAAAAGGVADPAGNLVDGDRDGAAGGDSDTRFKVGRGSKLSYKDADGDRVKLRVRGARGRPMTTLIGPDRDVHQVWVKGTGNTLVGSLRQGRLGNGLASIGRVVLQDPSNTSTLATPFAVGQTVIDGQVPVDPGVATMP